MFKQLEQALPAPSEEEYATLLGRKEELDLSRRGVADEWAGAEFDLAAGRGSEQQCAALKAQLAEIDAEIERVDAAIRGCKRRSEAHRAKTRQAEHERALQRLRKTLTARDKSARHFDQQAARCGAAFAEMLAASAAVTDALADLPEQIRKRLAAEAAFLAQGQIQQAAARRLAAEGARLTPVHVCPVAQTIDGQVPAEIPHVEQLATQASDFICRQWGDAS